MTVVTGPSGSGKSSLAFDTIYAEGQRRYVESLSVYARQFLEQLEKPEVESITGLSPTISIEQRTTSFNPRSTVGTVTEVHDYLRLLYSRIGRPFCYGCGKSIHSQSPQQIVDQVLSYSDGAKISILSPIVRGRKGEYQKELAQLRQKGFVRVRVDGETYDLSDEIQLDRNKKHDLSVYVDRLILRDDRSTLATRVSDSVDLALKLSDGLIHLEIIEGQKKSEILLSDKFACSECGISYPEPEPRTFSFNSPLGACEKCNGIGVLPQDEPEFDDLREDAPLFQSLAQYTEESCPSCKGARLKKESLHFRIQNQNIAELGDQSISELRKFFEKITLTERESLIVERVLKEIRDRLDFLERVGVGYLSLGRAGKTLSGGEAQRIRLATQIGSSLVGVIYVLDEPSIGLHPRDNERLIQTLLHLRDLGNTVLVVEHDQETMERSDWILDLGPGAGALGGNLVAAGTLEKILSTPQSLTGKYLRGEFKIEVPLLRRKGSLGKSIEILGASQNNLRDVDVRIPIGTFTCVTGVSGSGKSTLILDTLYRAVFSNLFRVDLGDVRVRSIRGMEHVDKVIDIDQSPIGKTPRSNPSTYTGLFSWIRDLFAQLPEAQIRGYKAGRFSFNVKGGRCETCEGAGVTRVEMHFLPDVFVTCEVCKGRRYNRETLDVKYKGKSISEVLDMDAAQALEFFDSVPHLKQKLKVLNEVGLGYIRLGQNATTLSGGEAQRIKLARELSRRSTGKTLYILDEPSTGLHFDDVKKLISILQELVEQGNTVIVIEHNLDIIKTADYILDMGPEGGSGGGRVVASGTPEEIAQNPESKTGRFLKGYLK